MPAKVKGLPELLAKLNDLGSVQTIERIAYRATFGSAKDLREAARQNAQGAVHSHTGALVRGWAIKRIQIGTKRGYTVGERFGRNASRRKGADNPYYWWFLEFGTVHVGPKNFFRRAIGALKGSMLGNIQRAGTKAVLDSGNRALSKYGSGAR